MLVRSGRLVWAVTAVICGASVAVPVWSVVTSPIVPIPLRLLIAGLWILAIVRPHAAVIGLALLVPFGSALIAAFDAAPIQYTEALVLTAISGLLIAAAREPHAGDEPAAPSLGMPVALFGAVVLGSLAVVVAVSQVGVGVRWLLFSDIATFLARDYLVGAPGRWTGVAPALQLLEGVAVLLLVIRSTRQRVVRPPQIMKAAAAAAGLAAALNVAQLVTVALRVATSTRDLFVRLLVSRVSEHVPDLNAAGSHFAMAVFVALALIVHDRRRGGSGRWWAVAALTLAAAMWVTGSRSAIVATALVVAGAAAVAGRDAWRRPPLWLIASAAVAAFVAGALILGFDPRAGVAGRGLAQTFESRAAFIVTGVRMIRFAPLFGVGIGRYYEMSGRFMPASIYWFFFHENAHNNFLQIGGELGLLGLAAFLWLLGAASLRMMRGLRASPDDRLLAGGLAGLAAFVITWLTGHPLLAPEVASSFWILAGAAVARADGNRRTPLVAPAGTGAAGSGGGRPGVVLMAAALILVVASVPVRARRESASLDLSDRTFGFYEWEGEIATGRMRWTSPSAGLFVPARTTEVDLPLRATFADRRPSPTLVRFAIDGRVFHQIERRDGDVFTLRLRLPPAAADATRPRRLDIITSPPWSPAGLLGTHDTRVLGVQVGEVTAR